jgi:hypothetical protein
LENEEMKASSSSNNNSSNNNNIDSLLERLGGFTGLTPLKLDREVAHGQTNCKAKKGFQHLCKSTTTAYAITHHRPMLEATRRLIHIQFWEECKV